LNLTRNRLTQFNDRHGVVAAPVSKAYFHRNLLCFLTLKRVPNTVRSSLIHSGSIVFKPSHKTLRQLHCDGHELDIHHVI
jgi:hypothetical protein